MGCGSRKDNIKAFSNFMVSISMKTRKINSNVVQREKNNDYKCSCKDSFLSGSCTVVRFVHFQSNYIEI